MAGVDNQETKTVNEIKLMSTECSVVRVTVYRDCAEVCREVEATLKEGVNELHITNFVEIDEDSIRVEGKGGATIAEVSLQKEFVTKDEVSMTKREKELSDEYHKLVDQLQEIGLVRNLEILEERWKVLKTFGMTAANHGQGNVPKENTNSIQLNADHYKGMTDLMEHYRLLGQNLEKEKLELERRHNVHCEKMDKVQNNLDELRGKMSPLENRTCIIVLEAEKETKVCLKVSYVVSNASWYPIYDLRMNTDQKELKLFYYGMIKQSTGEDWTDTKLFLSTAKPSVGGTIPTLPVTQLSIYRPRSPPMEPLRCYNLVAADDNKKSFRPPWKRESRGSAEYADINPTAIKVSDSTTSTTYEILRLSTIPSDNSPHKVSVGIADFKPDLVYVTVPKVVPHAFLLAKVVNTSHFTLLPGTSSIFLDNSFVAKAELKAVAPKEEFECSLGVDPGVRVQYKPLVKINSTSGLLSKWRCVTHEQVIEVKNVHSYAVEVKVKDELPRSLDEKIKVTLLDPHIDTKHPEKNTSVQLNKNILEWDLRMNEMTTVEVMLRYMVEYPYKEEIESSTTLVD